MYDWSVSELNKWDNKICKIASSYGLDWFEIDYEICDYYDMIGNMSYTGMPTHYHHWSFGKQFERTRFYYDMGLEGLPYEMIINSNPSIAYLMRENSLPMHILTMAHCVGHSDFFKNNKTFRHTDPENIISRFRSAAERIRKYVEDTTIGIEEVENILDACHSLKYQRDRVSGVKRLTHEEIVNKKIRKINLKEKGYEYIDLDKFPSEPDYNILQFIRDNSRNLSEWQKDIISIVDNETEYFIPQAQTKIMNEGWASFWHYKILHDLDLPQEFHFSFIKTHNQVIRPHLGGINPYHVGFKIFAKIEEEEGLESCFFAREVHNDTSFLMEHLDEKLCKDLNLFSFSKKKEYYSIDEISDDDGWQVIKRDFINSVGLNAVPKVYVESVDRHDCLMTVRHEFDGRELNLEYADKVCHKISDLWGDEVRFFTIIEDEDWEI
tara:strand:+ start:2855 stop:4165 length:1311 start_codon:yes stop_codon:yes gene_type:complete